VTSLTHARKLALASLAALALLVSACSSRPAVEDPPAAAAESPAADTAADTAVTVVDQRGKTVTLDRPAAKIASAVIPAPSMIAAVDGSWDRIVGVNSSLLESNQDGIIKYIFPASIDSPVISDTSFVPNMEEIIKLDPDVVIQWGDSGEDITKPLEDAGIPVVGLRYGTQEDLETWITLFGDVIGKADRAKAITDWMHEEAAEIETAVKDLAQPAPSALFLSYSPDALEVSNGATYPQYILDLAGATNVAKDAELKDGLASPEQLLAWDPDAIFLSSFSPSTPADFYADSRFAGLSAVKNHRVYRSPFGAFRWQVPCVESPLMWHWTTALLYPGKYKTDLPARIVEGEKFLYNYDIPDDQVDLILRTDINAGSADYDAVTG